MWPAALAAGPVQAALAGAAELRQQTLRLWGTPEAELAATLRRVDHQLAGLEITTCLRDGELEIVARYGTDAEPAYRTLRQAIETDFPDTLFSVDGATVDEQVAAALSSGGRTIAVGESCTGGLLTGRLTAAAGSSAWVLGGVAAYANSAKAELLGVRADVLVAEGAVSPAVALAMAEGARDRFGSDVGLGVTGIAGPGGGTVDKPVGTVHLAAAGPDGTATTSVVLSGSREAVRQRTTSIALHLLRRLLLGGPPA
jgi:nicotinamide-nucleotide amidase